jgi:hypothetical protein
MKNNICLAISLIAIIAVLVTASTQSGLTAVAKKHKSDDSSGFNRGAADAAKCKTDNCDKAYMSQPGKGWDDHSKEFNKNYAKGFCAAGGGDDDIVDGGVVDCGD